MGAKTPVSILQEMMVRLGSPPKYDLLYDGSGTHTAVFKYRVYADDVTAIGSGRSKKEAKHEAARLALEQISKRQIQPAGAEALPLDQELVTPYKDKLEENAIGALHDLCTVNEIPIPEYELAEEHGPPHAKAFTFVCCVSKQKEVGVGRTKKQAKQLAANNMMKRLKASLGDVLTDARTDSSISQAQDQTPAPAPAPAQAQAGGGDLEAAVAKYVAAASVTRKKISLKRTPCKYHDFFAETPKDIQRFAWEVLSKVQLPSNTLDARNLEADWMSHLNRVLDRLDTRTAIVPGRAAMNGNETVFIQLNFSADAVFCGSGASFEEAVQQAALRALDFLKIQLQTIEKEQPATSV